MPPQLGMLPQGRQEEALGQGPRQTIAHPPRKGALQAAHPTQSRSAGPSLPDPPCKDGAPAQIQE